MGIVILCHMSIQAIEDGIDGLLEKGSGVLQSPLAAGVGGALVGAAVGGTTVGLLMASAPKATSSSAKRKRKRITHTKRGWKQDRARRSKQKWEVAYQRRKKHSSSRRRTGVRYTKNGQPYIILKSGKARFIKGRRKRG